MKRTALPRFVTRFYDRHGKARLRFRRKGQAKPYYFRAEFGTAEFDREYAACMSGELAPKVEPGKSRIRPGTFNDLIRRYYAAPEFAGLAEITKKTYRGQIERFREAHGEKPVRAIERRHIKAIIGGMADRPGAANNLLERLKTLLAFAMEEGMRRDNPARGIKGFKVRSDGFHAWSDAEIAKFEAHHAEGTRARLAMALMLFTGQRRSDAIRMGWQHINGARIRVTQSKTGASLEIPVHPELARILEATPRDNLTFLTTASGRPFTAAGFGNWFREMCDEAGLPQCTSHGLRKAAARRMAEAGCTPSQIAAITGHATLAEVARYTKSADQARLADQAMTALRKSKKGTSVANPSRSVSQKGEKDE